jgi:hypothetical protein
MNKEYILICEYAWGCVPIDVNWAKGTTLYEETKKRLIEEGLLPKSRILTTEEQKNLYKQINEGLEKDLDEIKRSDFYNSDRLK